MGLDALGIEPNSRGQIEVNENLQTKLPNIYAVGDIIGFPALASAAYDQGRYASAHIVSGRSERALIKDVPTGIYTSPEISSLGRNERELTAEKIPYEIGRAQFKSLARAQITGQTVGTPAANVMDFKPFVNVMPFGMCNSMANPAVAAATAAAFGVLTPMPCVPATAAPWVPGSSKVLIGMMPALQDTAKLMCTWGGVIQVVAPSQFTTLTG